MLKVCQSWKHSVPYFGTLCFQLWHTFRNAGINLAVWKKYRCLSHIRWTAPLVFDSYSDEFVWFNPNRSLERISSYLGLFMP